MNRSFPRRAASLAGSLLLLLPVAAAQPDGGPPAADGVPATQAAAGEARRMRPGAVPSGRHVPADDEVQVAEPVRRAVLRHALLQRLSTVSDPARFARGQKDPSAWREQALGKGKTVPVTVRTPRGMLHLQALEDGSRVWLSGAMLRDERAILRLGDLLPLVKAAGLDDREAALAVTRVELTAAARPPSYTLSFKPGALWKHRARLAAAERGGRVWYSLTTGRVTVMGALVTADGKGDLHVVEVPAEGAQRGRLADVLLPERCRPFETALRSDTPATAHDVARAALARPNVVQSCAARYFSLVRPQGTADLLRKTLAQGQVGWPAELVEALAAVDAAPNEKNVQAVAALVKRRGAVGAQGVCEGAPLPWIDALLLREDLDRGARTVLEKCVWR